MMNTDNGKKIGIALGLATVILASMMAPAYAQDSATGEIISLTKAGDIPMTGTVVDYTVIRIAVTSPVPVDSWIVVIRGNTGYVYQRQTEGVFLPNAQRNINGVDQITGISADTRLEKGWFSLKVAWRDWTQTLGILALELSTSATIAVTLRDAEGRTIAQKTVEVAEIGVPSETTENPATPRTTSPGVFTYRTTRLGDLLFVEVTSTIETSAYMLILQGPQPTLTYELVHGTRLSPISSPSQSAVFNLQTSGKTFNFAVIGNEDITVKAVKLLDSQGRVIPLEN